MEATTPRATKIVATLGPASSSAEVLERMFRAGVDVVRLNFSHGSAQDHIDRAALVREVAKKVGKEVAIMADLQGPKIRVGKIEGGKTMLEPGEKLVLDAAHAGLGTNQRVGLDYKELPRDVRPGDTLLLNDGLLRLVVDSPPTTMVVCTSSPRTESTVRRRSPSLRSSVSPGRTSRGNSL